MEFHVNTEILFSTLHTHKKFLKTPKASLHAPEVGMAKVEGQCYSGFLALEKVCVVHCTVVVSWEGQK
jgi:hypothetical protein